MNVDFVNTYYIEGYGYDGLQVFQGAFLAEKLGLVIFVIPVRRFCYGKI